MVRSDEFANRRLQLHDAAMDAAPQLFVRELGEPAFHEVQPGAVGAREMDVRARALGEPIPDQRSLCVP